MMRWMEDGRNSLARVTRLNDCSIGLLNALLWHLPEEALSLLLEMTLARTEWPTT